MSVTGVAGCFVAKGAVLTGSAGFTDGSFLSAAIPDMATDRDNIVANNRAKRCFIVTSLEYITREY